VAFAPDGDLIVADSLNNRRVDRQRGHHDDCWPGEEKLRLNTPTPPSRMAAEWRIFMRNRIRMVDHATGFIHTVSATVNREGRSDRRRWPALTQSGRERPQVASNGTSTRGHDHNRSQRCADT
jgi:hypothetical protein